MQAEIIGLRHQLTVLQRNQKSERLVLCRADRCLWVWLSQMWSGWRSALLIVKPETVISWHRQGFRWYWTWKVRHGQPGRPCVPKETRNLIRVMSRENPLWGAPRIHGELMKLGALGFRKLPSRNTWFEIRNRHPKHGGHSSRITYRNSRQSTSSRSRHGRPRCRSVGPKSETGKDV
jgi:hypothetical protein